jgi:hypothetical protein
MDSEQQRGRTLAFEYLSAHVAELHGFARDCARGGYAEAYDQLWAQRREFGIQPAAAGFDFLLRRCFVEAALPAQFPRKMFYRIGDVEFLAIEACRGERSIEEGARRSDERSSGEVLRVAGLFADQHDSCMGTTFTEHRLRGSTPQVAGLAVLCLLSERIDIRCRGGLCSR